MINWQPQRPMKMTFFYRISILKWPITKEVKDNIAVIKLYDAINLSIRVLLLVSSTSHGCPEATLRQMIAGCAFTDPAVIDRGNSNIAARLSPDVASGGHSWFLFGKKAVNKEQDVGAKGKQVLPWRLLKRMRQGHEVTAPDTAVNVIWHLLKPWWQFTVNKGRNRNSVVSSVITFKKCFTGQLQQLQCAIGNKQNKHIEIGWWQLWLYP